jgi:hypothetical protein
MGGFVKKLAVDSLNFHVPFRITEAKDREVPGGAANEEVFDTMQCPMMQDIGAFQGKVRCIGAILLFEYLEKAIMPKEPIG